MRCDYFDAERCRSCTLMGTAYHEQLTAKQNRARAALAAVGAFPTWSEPFESRESGFRNKAKLVVAGSVDSPTLGILDSLGQGIDLRSCGLYDPRLYAVFATLGAFVSSAGLTPYDVPSRRGELKYLIVTVSPAGQVMVRFVLRSQHLIPRVHTALPHLFSAIPGLAVVSVNLHPEHKAVLEGDTELVLSGRHTLPMQVNDVVLQLRPKSFFQTNTEVAAGLYRQAQAWIDELDPTSVWDLYCGVGGFAMHAVRRPGASERPRSVRGIEISAEAIDSARESLAAVHRGDPHTSQVQFEAADATAYALTHPGPDLLIVNPPRRGISPDLAAWLERSTTRHLVYSSCNPDTLARDVAALPSFEVTQARVFDMFPHTSHQEVLIRATRR